MSEISIEYYKKTNIEISDELLYLLLERYRNLSEFDQNKIVSDYTEFEKNLNVN